MRLSSTQYGDQRISQIIKKETMREKMKKRKNYRPNLSDNGQIAELENIVKAFLFS